jgi:hypothetical protein
MLTNGKEVNPPPLNALHRDSTPIEVYVHARVSARKPAPALTRLLRFILIVWKEFLDRLPNPKIIKILPGEH